MNVRRTIPMYGQDLAAVFNSLKVIAEVVIHAVLFKVRLCIIQISIKQLLQSEDSVGFTRTICTLHPDGEFLLPVEHTDGILNQFYKCLVRKEFLPHIRLAVNDCFIYCREVVRINVKIMPVIL